MTTDTCIVRRCPNPVAYVLVGEAELEDGSRFASEGTPLCQTHRNLALNADPRLPIVAVEEVLHA